MSPMDILQFKIIFMEKNTFIKFKKTFFISKLEAHYYRVRNSLRYFPNSLNDVDTDVQALKQSFDAYLEFVTKHLEITEDDSKVWISSDLCENMKRVVPMVTKLEALEKKLRELCAKDWSKPCNLTDPRENPCGSEKEYTLKKYAFIVQALLNFNPLNAMRGPAVSASLVTEELTQTYWNRNVGMIYRVTPDNLIMFGTSDLNSNIVFFVQDNEIISTIFDWSWFGQNYHVDVTEGNDNAYFPISVFVNLCKKRYEDSEVETLDRYNEILLKPDFKNDVIGVFYRYDSSDVEVNRVKNFAEMSHIPTVRFNQDGSVTVFRANC